MAAYSPEQLALAKKIVQIGKRKGASSKEILAAIQTGIVESGLRNLSGGDRDSAGWRQERASLYKDPTNLTASINRFFDETRAVRDKYGKAGDLAAAVQRPAAQYRGRYQQVTGQAKKVLAAIGGGGGGGASGGAGTTGSGTTTSITEQPAAGTVATYRPGTDNAALRQQVTANYFQNRGKPGNLLALIGGLQNAQDVPGSLDTKATGSTTYTARTSSDAGAEGGAAKGRSKLLELYWQGSGGVNIKNGKKVPQGFVSGHTDHVHVAAGPKTAVSLGKLAQDMGLNVGENPSFGSGKVGKHATGSYHYRRQAIDVSGDPDLMRKYAQAVAKLYGVK